MSIAGPEDSNSAGERAFIFLWRVLAPKVLEEPIWDKVQPSETRNWRFDFAWPEQKLAVEIDGGKKMPGGGRHNSEDHMDKDNAATELWWRVLHYTPSRLNRDPHAVIEQVVRCLESPFPQATIDNKRCP